MAYYLKCKCLACDKNFTDIGDFDYPEKGAAVQCPYCCGYNTLHVVRRLVNGRYKYEYVQKHPF